ncbi:MAG: HIT domain-containing protein [Chloroflexota bacterium]|nr:HIT domain-containing protein [Chloroflexota bacterium]
MTDSSPNDAHNVEAVVEGPCLGDHRRLWTPWRMRYVGGEAPKDDCVFCRRLEADDDAASLILWRGDHVFAIMNLFPYNTGHLMLIPNDHVASPEDTDPAALREMATLLPTVLRALRRVLRCDGFNVGFNVGADAGAGVADHLHQHVVPRWEGDANFMPILAATMVLPELIPVTYAKVRAELTREATGDDQVTCVAFDRDRRVLARRRADGWRLPTADALDEESLWQAARRELTDLAGVPAEIIGWAGTGRVGDGRKALTFAFPDAPPTELLAPDLGWLNVAQLPLAEDEAGAVTVAAARYAEGQGSR